MIERRQKQLFGLPDEIVLASGVETVIDALIREETARRLERKGRPQKRKRTL